MAPASQRATQSSQCPSERSSFSKGVWPGDAASWGVSTWELVGRGPTPCGDPSGVHCSQGTGMFTASSVISK